MLTSLMILNAVVSVLLIGIVLLQFGKGAEAGLMSGAGGDSLMTGGQRGNILSKITAILAIIFFVNSIVMSRIQNQLSSKSIIDTGAPVARPLNSDSPNTSPKDSQAKEANEVAPKDGQTAPVETPKATK